MEWQWVNKLEYMPISAYLYSESTTLYFGGALLDNKRNAIRGVLSSLSEFHSKQMKSSMKLFVSTLNGQCFQALLMASKRTLQ